MPGRFEGNEPTKMAQKRPFAQVGRPAIRADLGPKNDITRVIDLAHLEVLDVLRTAGRRLAQRGHESVGERRRREVRGCDGGQRGR